MKYKASSIRAFIGAKDYETSRSFYRKLDFEEIVIGPTMSFFKVNDQLGFYLQNYYSKDWINNSMLFLEVDDVTGCRKSLLAKKLEDQFKGVRFTDIKKEAWGEEFFMHDPSGVLWHFGRFY